MGVGVPSEQMQVSRAMPEAYTNQSNSQVRATYIQGDYSRASGAIPLNAVWEGLFLQVVLQITWTRREYWHLNQDNHHLPFTLHSFNVATLLILEMQCGKDRTMVGNIRNVMVMEVTKSSDYTLSLNLQGFPSSFLRLIVSAPSRLLL